MTQMWEEILEQPTVLERCGRTNMEVVGNLAEYLKSRKIDSVVIAARGTSDHAGVYGKYIIEYVLGIPTALAAPSIFTVYRRDMKLENSLVIGISQSGRAEDVLEVVKSANKCGAVTVSITNDDKSPLAAEAGYHLYCNAGLEKSVAATKTFTSEMYLVALLVAEWSGNEEIKRELSGLSEKIYSIFSEEKHIIDRVERYRYINDCFVLARGVNYAIALESALKIQETTYVRASAYATSDFYHGPYAMVEKDTPIIIFAPDGPALDNMLEMIAKLRDSNAELIIVSNNEAVRKMGSCAFEIPETCNDLISPFYNVIIAQMFACRLALAKGLNPDSPRGLKKVTITK